MVRDETVRAGRSAPLRASVKAAQARRLAGALAWDRKADEFDAGPLIAASLAIWASQNHAGLGPDEVYVGGPDPEPPLPSGDWRAVANWPGMRIPAPLPPRAP